jgi:Holliday junction resolvase RusA-like endonuclease
MVRYGSARGPRTPIDEPVVVDVQAYHARPQRLRRRVDPRDGLPAPKKPDLDNVCKLAMDALVKAGVLVDDTRVVELHAASWYCPIDAKGWHTVDPHVRIRLALWRSP